MADAQATTNGAKVENGPPLKELQERLAPKLEEAQAQLSTLNERVKAFIRENPGTTMVGALALGYLVGRLASRK